MKQASTAPRIFEKYDIVATIEGLCFDETAEAAIATVNIVNNGKSAITLEMCDIYRDGELLDETRFFVGNVPAQATLSKRLISLATETDEQTVLKFYNGEIQEFSFRLCAYIHDEKSQYHSSLYLGKGNRITLSGISLDKLRVSAEDCFEIKNEGNYMIATADHYIPFELPKADTEKAEKIKKFKAELVDHINTLSTVGAQDVLFAQFGATDSLKNCDIENLLIYNLGTSAFADVSKTDIAFAEFSNKEQSIFQAFNPIRKYMYKYAKIAREDLKRYTDGKRLLVHWDRIPINLDIKHSAQRYWSSIRTHFEKVSVHGRLSDEMTDPFGIYVELHLPKKVSPANVVKSLLDGIICAFHRQKDGEELLGQFVKSSYEDMVANPEKAIGIFGEYPYIIKRGNSVQWSPADDRLKFCWLTVVQEETAPYFNGKIMEW